MEEILKFPSVLKKYYSRQGLWSLFLMCAAPLHIWAIILTIQDMGWVAERTDMWDAIGVMSYGLIFAFVESLFVFIFLFLLGFFISTVWPERTRISLLSLLIVLLSMWSILNHLYFLIPFTLPQILIVTLVRFAPSLQSLYIVILFPVFISISIPVYFSIKSEVFINFLQNIIERLSVLMSVYLLLDLAAIGMVIIRNT